MSLYNNTSPENHGNIFDTFKIGRSYFKIRTAISCVFAILGIAAGIILAHMSFGVYPTIIRDHNSRVYLGTSKEYTTSYPELAEMTIDIMRALFTRTPQSDMKILLPFVAENILKSLSGAISGYDDETLQSTLVHDFFITKTGKTVEAVMFMTIIQSNPRRIIEQPAYFNILLKYGKRSRTNPGGWKIVGLLRINETSYLEKRKETIGESSLLNPSERLEAES